VSILPRSSSIRSIWIFFLSFLQLVFLVCPQATWAKDDDQREKINASANGERIKAIDRTLLLEFIKLARFNIRFHQEANRHPMWRTLAYAAGRESGTAVSFASSLIDLEQRVRGLQNPSLISRNALRNAVNTALVGNTISGSASSSQLAQNIWVMLSARKQGYSPKASTAFVKSVLGTADALFDERERLSVADPFLRRRRLYEVENVLLHRIRQQLLFEFQAWSCQSRAQAWRENTFYGIDALQNFTRMSASIVALKGFTNPKLVGGSAITILIANSGATLNPLLCGLVGRLMHNYQFTKLSKEFPVGRPVTTPDERLVVQKLQELQREFPNDKVIKLLDESIFLSDKSARFDVVLDREARDIERLRRVAQQQTIAGPLIGLTSMPGPILGTVAFYDYQKDRVTTNNLLFAGRISALSGQSFALVQTPATIVFGMVRNSQLKKRGELPSQLLAERLKNLDALEAGISAAVP